MKSVIPGASASKTLSLDAACYWYCSAYRVVFILYRFWKPNSSSRISAGRSLGETGSAVWLLQY